MAAELYQAEARARCNHSSVNIVKENLNANLRHLSLKAKKNVQLKGIKFIFYTQLT